MTSTQSVAVIGDPGPAAGLADLFAEHGFDLRVVDAGRELPALDVDLVVEAVAEERKPEVLRAIAAAAGAAAILVTTTATGSVTELAAAVADPARVAGLHWGHRGAAAEVVEVVAAEQTDPAVVTALAEVVERLGRLPVVVRDNPGFLVNWLFLPYLNDVVRAHDEELATAGDIDLALELGLGYRTGPFRLLAEIGVEQHLAATTAAYAATNDDRFAPPPLLRRLALSRPATAPDDIAEKEGTEA